LCALAALTRAVADAWLLPALAVVIAAGASRGLKWRSALAVVCAFAVTVAPWTIRNVNAFHAFVPISTEGGFTLAGQYNADAGRDDGFQAVWRLPMQVSSLRRVLLPLYTRPGGIDEPQLDARLRHAGLAYLGDHPGHLAVALWLDTLRMFDLGKAHQFTTGISYRELNLPGSLRAPTTLSAQLVALLALGAVLLWSRRRATIKLGPWWLWAIPMLTIALTIPMVGNPRKRAPLDPFLLLLAALMIDWLVHALRGRIAARTG
jgi:uncharacterized membrane protein